MEIKINGIQGFESRLDKLGMRVKFAAMKAADDAAEKTMHRERAEMAVVFNKPTPWVIRGVEMTNANSQTMASSVYISNKQNAKGQGLSQTPQDVLGPHIFGGTRTSKAVELYLREKGILPADKFLAVAPGAWTDQYGNTPGYEISAIISQLKAYPDSLGMNMVGKTGRGKFKNFRYFVMFRDGRPLGIFAREKRSGGVQPILLFISRPTYKQVFHFFEIAKAEANRAFRISFDESMGVSNG